MKRVAGDQFFTASELQLYLSVGLKRKGNEAKYTACSPNSL